MKKTKRTPVDDYEERDLFDGDLFSPIQDQIIKCAARNICGCCGRRVGKTWSGTRKIVRWMHEDMLKLWLDVERGTRPRWLGEEMKPTVAQEIAPDVLYWIIAPRDEHLAQIRGNLLQVYMRNGTDFRHPKFPEWFTARNKRFWVWHDGVCGRFDFIPATGPSAMVSRGLHGAWIDEAGFVPNDRYLALRPTLWEHGGKLLATGTPALGADQWFTRLSISGVDHTHERYDPDIATRDPETTTFIADTVRHAYSEQARREAKKDAKFWGPIWAAQWIYADWRQRGLQIFREWEPGTHMVDFSRPYSRPGAGIHIGRQPWCYLSKKPIYDQPSMTYGIVDWSGGTAPGAAVVALVWKKNPLSPSDPRWLVVIVEDHEGHEAYTDDGWWAIMGSMTRRWGIDRWIGDPHAPRLIRAARKAGIPVQDGAHQDKLGRVSLVAALLHHDKREGVKPAMYVSRRCHHVPREISGYQWRRTREGLATNKPKDIDDHTTDCLAMLAAEVYTGTAVSIAGQYFG